jgi:hypothetical protein
VFPSHDRRGFLAKVDSENFLDTRAVTSTEENHVAIADGQTYFANTADTANTLTTATGNTYNLLYLENNSSTRVIVIEKIVSSYSAAGGVFIFQKNMTLGTASANNVHVPVNTNFSSGNVADVVCHNWDESGTTGIGGLSGGTVMKTFITAAGTVFYPIDGFVVLGQGDNIVLRYNNGTGGNVEVEAGIRFYFLDESIIG